MNPYDSCEVSSVFLIKRTFFFSNQLFSSSGSLIPMSFCSGSRISKQVQCQKDQ